jgi:hypothetical protein
MITGFNTDVQFEGRVFHVQTEDKGLDNPIIETLVYTGGQIVCARKISYAQMLTEGDCQESSIQHRMEAQHRELIREIQDGSLTGHDLQPFGSGIISDRAFDEVVASFLADCVAIENPKLEWIDDVQLEPGTTVRLMVRVTDEISDRPIAGAHVVVKHVGRNDKSTDLGQATSDPRGMVEIDCCMPGKPTKKDRIVCEALIGESAPTISKRFNVRPRSVQAS